MNAGDILAFVFLGLLGVGGFAGQLHLCNKAEKVITRLVPAIILLGIELVCLIVILVVGAASEPAEGISLMALSQMVICAVLLVPVELAWLVYGIKWFLNKKKNNPEVFGENT